MSKFLIPDSSENTTGKKVYSAFLFFNLIWIFMIIAAPVLTDFGGIFKNFSDILYIFFSKVCHQDESRCFYISGNIFAVCSRCFMIYAGFLTGIILYPFIYKKGNTQIPSINFLLFAVILLLADVVMDLTGIFNNTFISRSVTGFIIGIILPFYLLPGFVKFFDEVISFLKNKLIYKN